MSRGSTGFAIGDAVGAFIVTAPLLIMTGLFLADERDRMTPVTAFTVTASGLTLFGVSSAFWGLAAGLAVLGLGHARSRWLFPA